VQPIAAGLWRWTAPHPAWRPDAEPDSPGDWERDVGCSLFVTDIAAVFIDPLVPEDETSFWASCDPLVAGRAATVLTTIRWHGRSRETVAARYDADVPAFDDPMPEGVRALVFRPAAETFYWLEGPRTLVVGDRIIGGRGGGLRLCPDSWMAGLLTQGELRDLLAPVLDLPVERVLTSHGEPMLSGGAAELERILR
jgi:hypothetical protein